MPNQLSIARMRSKAFLNATADMHNGHGYDWFIEAMQQLDAQATTKGQLARDMNVTEPTLYKYLFIIRAERAQSMREEAKSS